MFPTIIDGLAGDSRCMQEEIFGPVVCVAPFTDEAEVIEKVNGVEYGLCASVWTSDVRRVHRIGSKLDVRLQCS